MCDAAGCRAWLLPLVRPACRRRERAVMAAIYRYTVPVDDRRKAFRLFGDIVHVGGRRSDEVEFWALHDERVNQERERSFLVVGTGHQLPYDFKQFIGTHVAGPLVWHLIEVS